jgi:hypothetical protein
MATNNAIRHYFCSKVGEVHCVLEVDGHIGLHMYAKVDVCIWWFVAISSNTKRHTQTNCT